MIPTNLNQAINAIKIIWPLLIFFLCMCPKVTVADEKIGKEESQQYFFGMMRKAKGFRVDAKNAGNYLHGVWRLDKKAHIGGGHYTRADKGDDVTLICNDERLIQVDFDQNHNRISEVTQQLGELNMNEDGSLVFGKGQRYVSLGENHMAVAAYDYIVLLQRVSGHAEASTQKDDVESGPGE